MPRFADDGMDQHKIGGSGYGFSAKRIDDSLGASEWTVFDLEVDVSGSVFGFGAEIEACVREAIKACRLSPRADNLMVRFQTFNHRLTEVHGFRPLAECDDAKYVGSIQPGGETALCDATYNGAEAVQRYGKALIDAKYACNGILVVITDGCENASKATNAMCKAAIAAAVNGEKLESLVTILVGVNVQDAGVAQYLKDFKDEVGFTQYVELKDASAKTLAKLAAFISKSVSSQSQSLGTGGPSQAQTF